MTLTTWHAIEHTFQFQTGAIKSCRRPRLGYEGGGFNSKLVRLKGYQEETAEGLDARFNSKLVRLKAVSRRTYTDRCARFQFQTGAIKSRHFDKLRYDKIRFNSKLVRLKVWDATWRRVVAFVSIPNWCD